LIQFLVKNRSETENSRPSMKSFLDQNAIFLVNVRLPREVRCYCCKASNEEASLYLNHNSIGEALILCPRCHQTYQNVGRKSAGA
jgi:hypothetical protein